MKFFKRQSVFSYFTLTAILSIVFIVLITISSYYTMQEMYLNLKSIYELKLQSLKATSDIRKDILYIRYEITQSTKPSLLDSNNNYNDVFDKDKEIKTLFNTLDNKYMEDDESRLMLANLKSSLNDYLSIYEKAKVNMLLGNEIPFEVSQNIIKCELNTLNTLDVFIEFNNRQADNLIGKSKNIYYKKLMTFVIIALTSCFLIIIILLLLIKTIKNSVNEVFGVLSKMTGGTGNLTLTTIEKNEFDRIKNTLSSSIIKHDDIIMIENLNIELSKTLTELRNTQDHLIQKERLSSLGHLIGGIAHNFKTPIMALSGNLGVLKDLVIEYNTSIDDPNVNSEDHHQISDEMSEWIEKSKPILKYMNTMISSVTRQVDATNKIKTNEKFSLNDLFENINILMSYELKKNSCVLIIEDNSLKNITINGQLGIMIQVINNLITNAIQAYCGKKGVVTLNVNKDQNNVILSVKDSGIGISEDVKEDLFKKMVTTKGSDGTGIGLYVSYSAIKVEYSGNIWFDSNPEIGTIFYVSIPLNLIN